MLVWSQSNFGLTDDEAARRNVLVKISLSLSLSLLSHYLSEFTR